MCHSTLIFLPVQLMRRSQHFSLSRCRNSLVASAPHLMDAFPCKAFRSHITIEVYGIKVTSFAERFVNQFRLSFFLFPQTGAKKGEKLD